MPINNIVNIIISKSNNSLKYGSCFQCYTYYYRKLKIAEVIYTGAGTSVKIETQEAMFLTYV